ncbi:hypothetical protein C173_10011 [Paenibacillus sp. FSL R7-277]|uniref:Mov34/MPN/PAD-1 family protein n=1 Tax=Paenibacillus sp. FSL R7-277 TaxID=1227352 RepID=UPI0003E2C5CB|nr:Mov34/MPN/PAD-1 family protein [Paenibacillus sp. FSL R7-277]ETT74126.1 hypothetical protein C173_10011 [Paenibacillus sp. FSL R7-277]
MIKILMPYEMQRRLFKHLKMAAVQEIGGILMGEHIEDGVFRIWDVTVQHQGGTWISFLRKIDGSLRNSLQRFFLSTRQQYTKYNYLGEWHSHPSFALIPSSCDQDSMWNIVNDPLVGANFAVLLILKVQKENLAGNVFIFAPGYEMIPGELVLEG